MALRAEIRYKILIINLHWCFMLALQLPATVAMVFFLMLLSGCSSTSKHIATASPLPYSELLQNATTTIPTLNDIFTLSAEQQAEFLTYYHAPEQKEVAGHLRLYTFLEKHLIGFSYLGNNYTAAEAYKLNSGNCISLAVLTKALADLVGIKIEFQIVESAPVYSIDNDLMVSSDHVRTFLYDPTFEPKKGIITLVKPAIIVDYLPEAGKITGAKISERTFIAMFYRNLAADKILAEQYEQALALLRTAMEYAPEYSATINLTAVTHRRLNEIDLAEQFYQYGLDTADNKIALLSNYAMLKSLTGEHEAAQALLQTLKILDEHAPYSWYLLGRTANLQHQYADAIIFLHKAIEQAPYMHQLYLELALTYFRDGQFTLAHKTLTKATELISIQGEKQRYIAKLEALKLYQSAKQ